VRVLYERQTETAAEAVVLPASKDPEVTARWIERCVAGVEPVPHSLKIQLACCLLACGESQPWSRASAASTTAGDRICRIKKARPVARTGKARVLKVFSGLIQWLTEGTAIIYR
jgi:anthranilate phosphoribosyltransferase